MATRTYSHQRLGRVRGRSQIEAVPQQQLARPPGTGGPTTALQTAAQAAAVMQRRLPGQMLRTVMRCGCWKCHTQQPTAARERLGRQALQKTQMRAGQLAALAAAGQRGVQLVLQQLRLGLGYWQAMLTATNLMLQGEAQQLVLMQVQVQQAQMVAAFALLELRLLG